MRRFVMTLACATAVVSTTSAETTKGIKMPYISFPMKEGKGMYATKGRCNMCHSWGYTINQGKQSRKFWERKVIKMITVFNAPIKNEDIKTVVDYLYENYGNGEEE